MRKFDPSLCLLQLRKFFRDEHLSSALFLEYLPNMEPLQLHNLSTERADKLVEGIRQIHNSLVRHNDPKPRNMMLAMQPNGEERVLWIDLGRAETYDNESITAKQHGFIEFEDKLVLQFKKSMVSDFNNSISPGLARSTSKGRSRY
ncbi:hypothetical protein BDV19DRAFT_166160 [Aspergillus venezuelensis]